MESKKAPPQDSFGKEHGVSAFPKMKKRKKSDITFFFLALLLPKSSTGLSNPYSHPVREFYRWENVGSKRQSDSL